MTARELCCKEKYKSESSGPLRGEMPEVAAGDLEAVKVLKSTSPVAWRDVNLIGNFDFTTSSTPVDIEALAARYQNEDFWRLSMQEGDEESPEQ